jgi:nucleotide-binding universal stress UspA family protein
MSTLAGSLTSRARASDDPAIACAFRADLRAYRSASAASPTTAVAGGSEAATVEDTPILICYDGSDGARDAITAAAALLAGHRALVLDVGPLLMVAESYAAVGPNAADLGYLISEDAVELAEEGAELARRAGFRAAARSEVAAETWQGVVEVADEIGASVIVLGSRGLTGIHELLEGSVSREVAEHAGRPVLIVPPLR